MLGHLLANDLRCVTWREPGPCTFNVSEYEVSLSILSLSHSLLVCYVGRGFSSFACIWAPEKVQLAVDVVYVSTRKMMVANDDGIHPTLHSERREDGFYRSTSLGNGHLTRARPMRYAV